MNTLLKYTIIGLLLIILCTPTWTIPSPYDQQKPVSPEQVFSFSAHLSDQQTLVLDWTIAPGYYLYRHAFAFAPLEPQKLKLGQPLLPEGKLKNIPRVGKFEIYQDHVTIGLPILSYQQNQAILQIHYQGCSQQGYCYPPTTKLLPIDFKVSFNTRFFPLHETVKAPTQPHLTPNSWQSLFNNHWPLLMGGFFIFGLLLSLTPCVLPMIPILSAIILKNSKSTTARNLGLSLTYVVSMSITYAGLGIIFGYLGYSLQTTLQQSWLVIVVSLILVFMALSLFGCFQLQLPEWIRARAAQLSHQQSGGHYGSAAIMGCLSTLILSPCVTPPLVAALSYISQTGNSVLGALALFAMGFGMGTPLLIMGAWGPRFLPKTGPWMNQVKNFLGFILLFLVIWLLSRLLSPLYILLLTAALLITIGLYWGALSTAKNFKQWLRKIVALAFCIYGLLLIFSSFFGNHTFWPAFYTDRQTTPTLSFITVQNVTDVEHEMAKSQRKPVILDFYADWCLACKQMEMVVFTDPKVQHKLAHFLLLRADVTDFNADHQSLLRHYQVIGPPTVLFFNSEHKEIFGARIVGETSVKQFLHSLSLAVTVHEEPFANHSRSLEKQLPKGSSKK